MRTLADSSLLYSRHAQPYGPLWQQLLRLLLSNPTPNKFGEVQAHLSQHARMFLRQLQTLIPRLALLLHTAQLPLQYYVEVINMLFRPLDARRHDRLREAGLERGDGVLDDKEVDVGDLEDVVWQVAFECALPGCESVKDNSCSEGGSRTVSVP